jgi:hypothetical protein
VLAEIHNYHTLMAVLSALNEAPIYRLKSTKEKIPEKHLKVL